MPSRVCVDINIALRLVLPEADSAKAQALWAHWVARGTEVVAPPLFLIEGASVLCTQVYRGLITPEESQLLFARCRPNRCSSSPRSTCTNRR